MSKKEKKSSGEQGSKSSSVLRVMWTFNDDRVKSRTQELLWCCDDKTVMAEILADKEATAKRVVVEVDQRFCRTRVWLTPPPQAVD